MEIFIIILVCYLIGSIPTAYLAGKIFQKKDIRKFGSGNVGTTNAFRVLGKKLGILTLIIDIGKGFLPVFIIKHYFNNNINYQLISGFSLVIGHIFTLFLKFKGGKGVATSAGFLLALTPLQTSFTIVLFIICLLTSKYVSLSSIIASISYPIFIFILGGDNKIKIISILLAILITLKHKSNIIRLINGNENSISKKEK